MDSSANPGSSVVARALARGRVGSVAMISFVGSSAAPLMVVAALISTAWAVTGFVAIPVVMLLIGLVLAIFAVGYTLMSRYVTNAGALYSYVAHGLGKPPGVGAAAVAVVAYSGLQVGIFGIFGSVSSGLVSTKLGWAVPWWAFGLGAWLVVAILGVLRVDLNGKVLTLLLGAECAIILVADVAMLANPADGQVSLAALAPSNLATAAIGAPIVVVATAFVGFEAPTVYAEEARDPRRSVPTATFAGLGIVAGLYALSSWALTVFIGPGRIVTEAGQQGADLLFNSIATLLGGTMGDIARLLLVTSMFAGLLAFHNTVARYIFALGREGVLPSALGRTALRSGAPKNGSLVQSAISLVVVLIYAAAGLDPVVDLFFTFGTGGGLGVLMLLAVTSFSVLAFFARRRVGLPLWQTAVLPGLACLGLVTGVGLAVVKIDTLLGVPPGSLLTWLIPMIYLLTALAGVAWGLVLRTRNPATYASIGRGAEAERESGATPRHALATESH